jgi:hypothetical protein
MLSKRKREFESIEEKQQQEKKTKIIKNENTVPNQKDSVTISLAPSPPFKYYDFQPHSIFYSKNKFLQQQQQQKDNIKVDWFYFILNGSSFSKYKDQELEIFFSNDENNNNNKEKRQAIITGLRDVEIFFRIDCPKVTEEQIQTKLSGKKSNLLISESLFLVIVSTKQSFFLGKCKWDIG